jgi:hypothetical protein
VATIATKIIGFWDRLRWRNAVSKLKLSNLTVANDEDLFQWSTAYISMVLTQTARAVCG